MPAFSRQPDGKNSPTSGVIEQAIEAAGLGE
jgi:hypothetical protein